MLCPPTPSGKLSLCSARAAAHTTDACQWPKKDRRYLSANKIKVDWVPDCRSPMSMHSLAAACTHTNAMPNYQQPPRWIALGQQESAGPPSPPPPPGPVGPASVGRAGTCRQEGPQDGITPPPPPAPDPQSCGKQIMETTPVPLGHNTGPKQKAIATCTPTPSRGAHALPLFTSVPFGHH